MDERAFWLAWSQVAGIGPTLLVRIKQHFGQLADAWEASVTELAQVDGLGIRTAESVAKARSPIDPMELLDTHQRQNPRFWTPADPDYPKLLLEIPDPPAVLYYRGQVRSLENQGETAAIAIVGTRYPSDYGRRWTRRITQALVRAGYTVISGLADGIDSEAHQVCVNLGGRTIAVVGTGVDQVYPISNRRLAERILEQGLMLSEYPTGTKPNSAHFPQRNRIIAGLCRATLVLEAPHQSGALITARQANEYGRDIYALPGSLDNQKSLGCLDLINKGAQVILGEQELLNALENLPQVTPRLQSRDQQQLSLLDLPPTPPLPKPEPIDLPPELQQVFEFVPSEAIALDRIIEQSGLPTEAVSGALVHLELIGVVTQLPGLRYQRS